MMSVSRFSGLSGISGSSRLAMLARGVAAAIAMVAIVDPVLSFQRAERPSIRIIATGGADTARVSAALQQAGFSVNAAEREAATVVVGDRPPKHSLSTEHSALSTQHSALSTQHSAPSTDHSALTTPVWGLETGPRSPNVRVGRATAAAVRLPEQAVAVSVDVLGEGVSGQITEIALEDAGIVVATSRHAWTESASGGARRCNTCRPDRRADGSVSSRRRSRGKQVPSDNVADVPLPVARGPVRLLVIEAGVTWPAVFVRRALEGEAAFAVSALQRASKSVATRAGSPPAALTRGTLVPFEVALVGGPDNLTTSDLDALRWFVESRGGVVVFVPDQRPAGRYGDLAGVAAFESRVVETPLTLTEPGKSEGSLSASELMVPKSLPPGGPSSRRILPARRWCSSRAAARER